MDDFVRKCKTLGIPVESGDCAIAAAMEGNLKPLVRGEHTLVNDSCHLSEWPVNISLVVTRVPAPDKDGDAILRVMATQAYYHMSPNSLVYLIVNSCKDQKTRPWEIISTMQAAGFRFIDNIIWIKDKFTPVQGGKRLNNVYDNILMFSKGDNYHLDRKAVSHLRNRIFKDAKNHLCPGNVWFIPSEDRDVIPDELIQTIFDVSNVFPESCVADPFMLDGAILRVSVKNSLSFWGCEKNKERFQTCKRILDEME